MKIIQQGRLPEESVYRGYCCNCRTIFEFQRREADYEQADSEGTLLMYVSCPLPGCGSTVMVPENQEMHTSVNG